MNQGPCCAQNKINTIITAFSICSRRYCTRFKYPASCKVGSMTKDNIPIKQLSISIKQLLFYLFDGHVKNLQRETKLFEISRDTNMEELNIRKKYITLQWLCCNIVIRKKIGWIYGSFSWNFWNMSTMAGWSFTEGYFNSSSKSFKLAMLLKEFWHF